MLSLEPRSAAEPPIMGLFQSNSPRRNPGCARAVRPAGSTRMPFIGNRSIIRPPAQTDLPA